MSRDPQKHRAKAERNEHFAESLDKSDPIRESWAVIAAFYSALHYVEQFLAGDGKPSGNHRDRDKQIKTDLRIRAAYPYYKYLSDLSQQARYHCVSLPDGAYDQLARPRLLAVKNQIDHALKLESQHPTARTTTP